MGLEVPKLKKTIINNPFDKKLALKVCESASIFNNYVDNIIDKKIRMILNQLI